MNRALGGGRLDGRKLVRLVYLDEAGISNPTQEPYVVVAGIIVHADHQLEPLEKALNNLIAKHIPEDQQERFVFHAKDLFHGGGVFDRQKWTLEKRLQIADEIAALPKKLHLRVALSWLERSQAVAAYDIPASFGTRDKSIAVLTSAFIVCVTQVERWMRQHAKNEVCMLVVEDNPDARSTIARVQRSYQDRNFIVSDDVKNYFPFKKIKEAPLFQKKEHSSPLQMADFCAYVCKRWVMEGLSQQGRYWRYLEPMKDCFATFTPD